MEKQNKTTKQVELNTQKLSELTKYELNNKVMQNKRVNELLNKSLKAKVNKATKQEQEQIHKELEQAKAKEYKRQLELYFKEYRTTKAKSERLQELEQETKQARQELAKTEQKQQLNEFITKATTKDNTKELLQQQSKYLATIQKCNNATNKEKKQAKEQEQQIDKFIARLEQEQQSELLKELEQQNKAIQKEFKELQQLASTCKAKELSQKILEFNQAFTKELELSINYNSFYNLCKYVVIKSLKTLQAKGNILAIKLLEYKDKYTIEDLIQNVATYYIEQHFNYASFKALMYQRATEQEQDKELQQIFLNGFKLTSKYLYQFKQKEFKTFYLEDLSNHKEYTLEQVKEQQINNNKVHYTLYRSFEKYLIANNFNKENMELNASEFKHLKAKAKQKEQLKTLTDYQLEIFLLKAKGYTNSQIAIAKDSNTRAIEKVIQRVYSKLDVKRANNEQKQKQKQAKTKEQEQELEIPCKTTINKALVTKYFKSEQVQSKLSYLKQEQEFKDLKANEFKAYNKAYNKANYKRTTKGYTKLYKIA